MTSSQTMRGVSSFARTWGSKTFLILAGVLVATRMAMMIPLFCDPGRWGGAADATIYPQIAENLLDGYGFSIDDREPYLENSGFAPGYPYFLAGLYAVFGRSPYPAAIIQILFLLLVLAVLYRFILARYGSRSAMWMGIFFITDMNLAMFSFQQLSEPLFLVLFVPGLLLFLKALEDKSIRNAIIAGGLLGLATLVRTITLYFAVPLLLFVLTLGSTWRRGFKWFRLLQVAIILVVQLLIITPWIVRNRVVFGQAFYSTVADINLHRYHASPLKALLERKNIGEAKQELADDAQRDASWKNGAEYNQLVGRKSKEYVLGHPLPYIGLLATGAFTNLLYPAPLSEMWFYFNAGEDLETTGVTQKAMTEFMKGRVLEATRIVVSERVAELGLPLVVFAILYSLFYFFKLGCGIRAYITRGLRDPVMLLFLITGIYFLAFLGFGVTLRMRVPLDPLIASLAGLGLASRITKKTKPGEKIAE